MQIPIIGKPELGPYPTNMFFSQAAHKDLNLPGLMGTPGLKPYYDSSYARPVRGLKVMGSNLYAVIGDRVYKINNTLTGTLLTGTLSTTSGPVCMEHDGTNLMIVDPNVEGYTYTLGGSVTAIADADFPTPSFVTWQDGYFIVTEKDSGRFWIPTLYDPTDWDGSDWTTAEGNPDNILAILSDHEDVFCFGSESIQPYYNSGNSDFPFEVRQGSSMTEGIGAAHSSAAGDSTVFFLDTHGRVMRILGYNAQPISSRNLEKEISELSTFADAIGFYYTQQGHGFYALNFPTGNITLVFDVTTQMWHKRKSYPIALDGTEGRWRANCYTFFDGKHIVGDWQYGQLYELDFDTYTDNGETIRRIFDLPAIGDGETRVRHNRLKVDYKAGVGLTTGQGSDPQAMLKWSDDGMWSNDNELWTSIGKMGEYDKEVIFGRLGAPKRRVYRNIVSDPVEVVVTGAHLN